MPKQVDHEERRREIAAAVLRLVTTRGVEAASLRNGGQRGRRPSMGAVQHDFTTKDEMPPFRARVRQHAARRARRQGRMAEQKKPATRRGTFRLFCTLLIPLDEDSRAGGPAVGRAHQPRLRRRADPEAGRPRIRQPHRLRHAPAQTTHCPGADAGQAALHLVSVIEGLRWPVLFGVYSEQQAMDVLDAQLDLIFGSALLRQSRTTDVGQPGL